MKKIQPYLLVSAASVLFFFGAFATYFFKDDFYFLKVSKQFDLISYFSPIRSTFYRPLSTEFFYFILQKLPFPLVTGHILVLLLFLIGVYFLYRTLIQITSNQKLSLFSSVLYLFHFSHIYQLYWFATFQEVALFTLIMGGLYSLLNKQYVISLLLFIGALFSKEQALIFPFVAILFYFIKYRKIHKIFIYYFILDGAFIFLHLFVKSQMPILKEYIIHFNPQLIVNNLVWYGLWSIGFPAMMSDYMRSLFSLPFGDFWNYFAQPSFKLYFFGMIIYWIGIIFSFIYIFIGQKKERKYVILITGLSVFLFALFLLPVLPIIHKWMVRLTIPLIFVCVIQGMIFAYLWVKKSTRPLVFFLLGLYLVWNYFGIKQHEVISTFTLESSISKKAELLFKDTSRFSSCRELYIKDPSSMKMGSWDGSEKIALTLFGDSFLSTYFPDKKMKIEYEYKVKTPSPNACIIGATELLN